MLKNGKWSNHYSKCTKCQTKDAPHRAAGLCAPCFDKRRYRLEKKQRQDYYKKYWIKNKNKLSARMAQYYLDHKAEFKAYNKAYALNNPAKVKRARAGYYQKNKSYFAKVNHASYLKRKST